MPKKTKQVQGEIINAIKALNKDRVSMKELETVMESVGIEPPTTIKYTERLIELKLLERVAGGFRLTEDGQDEGVIIIRVSPKHNRSAVVKGLTAALQQFKPLVTMEIEA